MSASLRNVIWLIITKTSEVLGFRVGLVRSVVDNKEGSSESDTSSVELTWLKWAYRNKEYKFLSCLYVLETRETCARCWTVHIPYRRMTTVF